MPTDYPSNNENPRESAANNENAAWGIGLLIAIVFIVGAIYWDMTGQTAHTDPPAVRRPLGRADRLGSDACGILPALSRLRERD